MKQASSERLSILHKVTQLIGCENAEQESQAKPQVSHPCISCIWNPILLCCNLVPLTADIVIKQSGHSNTNRANAYRSLRGKHPRWGLV